MTTFGANLMRVVAVGYNPSNVLLEVLNNVNEHGGENKAITAYNNSRSNWDDLQKIHHDLSKEFLYAAVMLRAAAILEASGQDERVDQDRKCVEVSITLRIRSKSADVEANRNPKTGQTGHEKPHPILDFLHPATKSSGGTDPRSKMAIANYGTFEDPYALSIIDKLATIGFACPP